MAEDAPEKVVALSCIGQGVENQSWANALRGASGLKVFRAENKSQLAGVITVFLPSSPNPHPSCFMGDIPKYLPDEVMAWMSVTLLRLVTSPPRTFPVKEAGLGWFAKVENLILLLTTLKPGCYRVQLFPFCSFS